MKSVVMYMKPACPYCQRAAALLDEKGAHVESINLLREPERRDEMIEKSGGRTTVPQIFIDGQHIGGCDDLQDLDAQGKLDSLLAG